MRKLSFFKICTTPWNLWESPVFSWIFEVFSSILENYWKNSSLGILLEVLMNNTLQYVRAFVLYRNFITSTVRYFVTFSVRFYWPSARVTVVGSVWLLSQISPMERLFVPKTLSRTRRETNVKTFVGFSLKPFRCRDTARTPFTAIRTIRHFFPLLRKAGASV